MTREYRTEKAGKLKHPKTYIRQSKGTEEELRALGRSYLRRALYPIIVRLDLEIADGNRRLDGVLLEAGPEAMVPICVTDEEMTEAVMVEVQIESDAHTRRLRPVEQYAGAKRWLELSPGATADQLAHKIGVSSALLCRVLSLSRCIPAVQEAAQQEKITASDWYAISKASTPDEQMALLDMKLKGCSRDQLEAAGRKRRNGNTTSTVKMSRVKFPIDGAVVTVQGEEASLEDIITTLTKLLKAAKKANDESIDVRTFARVCADQAGV